MLNTILFALIGYLLGSLPFAVWISRAFIGVDVRDHGSGHATATNAFRQAGIAAGALVFLLDIAKGALPVFLASQLGESEFAPVAAGAAAIAGHIWPLYAGFRGGMGLATTTGAFLMIHPLAILVGGGLLIILVLLLKHSARAVVVLAVSALPVFWVLGFPKDALLLTVLASLIVGVRYTTDWRRKYRELWLDRSRET